MVRGRAGNVGYPVGEAVDRSALLAIVAARGDDARMRLFTGSARFGTLIAGLLVAVLLVAAPAFGADPSPSPGGGTSARPERAAKAERGQRVKPPKVAVTRTGTVASSTDSEGRTTYTMTVAGTIYALEAGPSWWWGDKHPLAPYVGKNVEIAGSQAEGSTEIDVKTVDGKAVRAEGRPPWAGGWKVVGSKHPGWAQWKVDRQAAKGERGLGREKAPGQLKDKTPDPDAGPD